MRREYTAERLTANMCYSKADGGYRCMPSQSLLHAFRGTGLNNYVPRSAYGAFWLSEEKPLELSDLKDETAALHYGLEGFELSAAEYEREVAHLGNMIAQYSDAKVEDFDVRLKEAQKLYFVYRAARYDHSISESEFKRMERKVTDANLALGYEVRSRLRETMAEILPFGEPIKISVEGNQPEHVSMLYSASKFFPSTWNQTLSSKINLHSITGGKASWFKPSINEIRITNGYENFSSYPSIEASRAARSLNSRQYETQVEMVHELSHKFESIEPRIGKVSRNFLERRAVPLPTRKYNFNAAGKVIDHFAAAYVGEHYGSKINTEIFSMGMETTFLGTNGSLIGLALPRVEIERDSRVSIFRADIEHRNLTIGILAGITPSFNQDTMGQPIKTVFGDYNPNEKLILG